MIIGQDPYHGLGQAEGLSFSVPRGVSIPPSLKNIYKELQEDLGFPIPACGHLGAWVKQGVLLLNASLTVLAGKPNSHSKIGWQWFTDSIVKKLAKKTEPIVFILWGKFAQKKCEFLLSERQQNCFVISSVHPSPYSARNGFFSSQPFSKTNTFFSSQGVSPVFWGL